MKFSKNFTNKKCAPKMIFFYEKSFRKIWIIFNVANWLWKSEFCNFLTVFTQLTARNKNFLRGRLLFLGLKEGLLESATVWVILTDTYVLLFIFSYYFSRWYPFLHVAVWWTKSNNIIWRKRSIPTKLWQTFQIIVRFKFLFLESDESKVISGSSWHRTYAFTSWLQLCRKLRKYIACLIR